MKVTVSEISTKGVAIGRLLQAAFSVLALSLAVTAVSPGVRNMVFVPTGLRDTEVAPKAASRLMPQPALEMQQTPTRRICRYRGAEFYTDVEYLDGTLSEVFARLDGRVEAAGYRRLDISTQDKTLLTLFAVDYGLASNSLRERGLFTEDIVDTRLYPGIEQEAAVLAIGIDSGQGKTALVTMHLPTAAILAKLLVAVDCHALADELIKWIPLYSMSTVLDKIEHETSDLLTKTYFIENKCPVEEVFSFLDTNVPGIESWDMGEALKSVGRLQRIRRYDARIDVFHCPEEDRRNSLTVVKVCQGIKGPDGAGSNPL